MKRKGLVFRAFSYVYVLIGCLLIGGPMYLTVANAMKDTQQFTNNFFAPPESFYLENFINVISKANYFRYVFNSAFVMVVGVALILLLVPLTAFPVARHMRTKRYYRFLYYFILLGIFVPFQVKMLPIVKLMASLKLMNPVGLVLLYGCGALCQDIFLMVGYIQTLPRDLEEAAAIDGCTRLGTMFRIVYPLLSPMLATILIKDALWIWNDFQMPLLILNVSTDYWTLPLFQYNFKSTYSVDFTMAFAAFTLSILPMMLIFLVAQKKIMGGLTSGAVKS